MVSSCPNTVDDAPEPPSQPQLPLERSVGYQIRATHRLLQRALQARLENQGVTLGMWYFLRVLWVQDGITQSELSRRVGTMEPTTLVATRDMERAGIIRRIPDLSDRRKINIFLTDYGRELETRLLPFAIDVVDTAVTGLSPREVSLLLELLACIQRNLQD